ncbi:MAG: GntR family transcriptional regulator [Lachnospiraceae bacterium]|nr:GntR family transcriptional regulator [Lachnospiraceae bacterium]MBQ8316997.1 GntR family transcriptional regulator [Lachnospiraceae bacterium]MBR3834733.1 GntR family transcriptional regulator [Lachnospiraceae bacterium]
MNLIINNSSMTPIYEQIVMQMKDKIISGQLKPDVMLPSVRTLSKDLRISALTVKKAYDAMEQEGYIVTVHGKGSFVANINPNIAMEEKQKEVEKLFEQGIRKARECGMSNEDTQNLFEVVLSDFQ